MSLTIRTTFSISVTEETFVIVRFVMFLAFYMFSEDLLTLTVELLDLAHQYLDNVLMMIPQYYVISICGLLLLLTKTQVLLVRTKSFDLNGD